MTCAEIKISLHDYIDGQLNLVAKKAVNEHLSKCDVCFREYQRMQDFFNVLQRLPYSLEPTEDIIESFSRELLQRDNPGETAKVELSVMEKKRISKEEKLQEKRLKAQWSVIKKSKNTSSISGVSLSRKYRANKSDWRRLIFIPVIVLIIASAYFIYDYQKRNSPWNIEVIDGQISINGKHPDVLSLSSGEVLKTIGNSSAFLSVPKTGKIHLMQNTAVVLLKAKDGDNKIKLESGSIKVFSAVDMPDLSVELNNILIHGRSGSFTILLDENNNAMLLVNQGFVEMEYNDESIFAKEGYECKIKKGRSPGLPYRMEAPDTLKKEIEKYDASVDDETIIKNIISFSGKEDALTLLSLLPRVSMQERQILFQQIANYFQPPVSVTRMGILKGDKEMIYEWWEEIEWQL